MHISPDAFQPAIHGESHYCNYDSTWIGRGMQHRGTGDVARAVLRVVFNARVCELQS